MINAREPQAIGVEAYVYFYPQRFSWERGTRHRSRARRSLVSALRLPQHAAPNNCKDAMSKVPQQPKS